MVFIQHLGGVLQLELIVGAGVPGKLGDPLEIGADDLGLHRLPPGPFQAAELALHLDACLPGKIQLVELLAKLVDLAVLIVVPQFLLDRPHLLAEEHLALPLTQLFLDLRLDLGLRLQHPDLSLDMDQDSPQPLLDAQGLQQGLLLADWQLNVAGDQVREPAWVGDGIQNLVQHLLGQAFPLAQFPGPLAGFLVQGGEGGIVLVDWLHLLDRQGVDRQRILEAVIVQGRGADFTLKQELHAAQSPLHLADPANHAHRVELFGGRLVHVLALRHREDQVVSLECCLDRAQRPRTPDSDRHRDAGKDDRSP